MATPVYVVTGDQNVRGGPAIPVYVVNPSGGGGGGAVDSVFGRTGVVVAAGGDYIASQITVTPTGAIAATNVQAALAELDTEKQPASNNLSTLAGLSDADGNFIVGSAGGWVVESGATVRASLGLTIGTNVQAQDAELQAIAGLVSAADQLPYFTGLGTAALTTLTSFGRSLIDDVNEAAARTTIGVVAGGAGDVWIEKAGDTMTGTLILPDGVAATPALRFTTGSDDGFFQPADSAIGIAILGAEKMRFTHSGGDPRFALTNGGRISWYSGTSLAGTLATEMRIEGGIEYQTFFRATTNSLVDLVVVRHQTTGAPAAGFGSGILLQGESSTTIDQDMARLSTVWQTATHASRVADVMLEAAYSGGISEILRGRGGASAAVGFLGATPSVRLAHIVDPSGGGTVDAEARTAINAILVVLETFGFTATS